MSLSIQKSAQFGTYAIVESKWLDGRKTVTVVRKFRTLEQAKAAYMAMAYKPQPEVAQPAEAKPAEAKPAKKRSRKTAAAAAHNV